MCYLCAVSGAILRVRNLIAKSGNMPLPTQRILRLIPLVLALLAAFAPAALHAQVDVPPGTQVRVLAPSVADSLLRGRVVAIDSASLLLAPSASGSLNLPISGIQRLDRFRPGPRKTLQGALAGTVLGAAAGFGIAYASLRNSQCDYLCGAVQVGSAILGGAVGVVGGGIIGSRSRGEGRWEPVPIAPVRARP
jgi:hypothetical protein